MAKQAGQKVSPSDWVQWADAEEVEAAYEDAITDAYGEYEQHVGLLTMVGEEMEFPFPGRVLGKDVTVVGMEWPEDDEFGLDLLVEKGGTQHRIEARSVELLKPLPEGHLFLAAYLDWKHSL